MNVEERIRNELANEGARLIPGPGDVSAAIRRGRTRKTVALGGMAAGFVAVAVAGVLVFSQGPGPGRPVETEGTTAGTPTTAVPSTTLTTQPPTTTPVASPTHVVVATQNGIATFSGATQIGQVDLGPVMLAVDDLAGGYVLQIGTSASDILWFPSGAADPTDLIVPRPGESLRLFQVADMNGAPNIVYVATTGLPGQDTFTQQIHLYDLAVGTDRAVGDVGAPNAEVTRVSYGAGLFLLTVRSTEGLTWFEAVDGQGRPVTFTGSPQDHDTAMATVTVWVGEGAIAPDGGTMAFLRGSPRSESPFDLVVVDWATGEETLTVPVTGARDTNLVRLDWDGRTAVISLTDWNPIVITDGTATDGPPVVGTATIAP